jgi:hypothetical protein
MGGGALGVNLHNFGRNSNSGKYEKVIKQNFILACGREVITHNVSDNTVASRRNNSTEHLKRCREILN